MRNINRGNVNIETIIIICLIAITAIFVFQMLGKNVNQTLSKSNTHFTAFDPFGAKQQAGQSSLLNAPASTKPKASVSCTGNNCTVTINSTEFKNIPTDLSSSIATSGASGATSVISDILNKIAEATANDVQDPAISQYFRDIANQGYALAKLEADMFNIVQQCGGYSDCLDPAKKIPGLTILGKDGQSYTYPTKKETKIIKDAGKAMKLYDDIAQIYEKNLLSSSLVSSETKALTESLLGELKSLTQGFLNGYDAVMDTPNSPWATAEGPGTMNDLQQYSVETNLTSLMICAISDGTEANMPCTQ